MPTKLSPANLDGTKNFSALVPSLFNSANAALISANSAFVSANTGSGGPKIASVAYIGDDTAANVGGGDTITITGSNFQTGAAVYLSGNLISTVTVTSNTVSFTSPSKATGSYTLNVVNPDGSIATHVPGVQYSGMPVWTTAAGTLGTKESVAAVLITFVAPSDSTVTYSLISGTLPSGVILNSSTGVLSGTTPSESSNTTYNFTICATDAQNQDTDRAFSITINKVV